MSLDSVPIQEDLANLDFEELVVVVFRQGSLQQRSESHGERGMCGKSADDQIEGSKVAKAEDQGDEELMK